MIGITHSQINNQWICVFSERDYNITTYNLDIPLTSRCFKSFAIGIKGIHSDAERYSGWRMHEYPIDMANGSTPFFLSCGLGDNTTWYIELSIGWISETQVKVTGNRISSFPGKRMIIYGIT